MEMIASGEAESTKSRHMSGDAVDLHVGGYSGRQLVRIARGLFPNTGIGVLRNSIHLDFRGTRKTWNYNK